MDNNDTQYKPSRSIAKYLCFGSKAKSDRSLGFELEHFVVEKESHAPVPFCVDEDSELPSVEKVLKRLKPLYENADYESDSGGPNYLFSLSRDRANLTLEPGAQLEISIGPARTIKEIEEIYLLFRSEIDPILDEMGIELLELGYHPTAMARDISLLPKARYRFMNEHFSHTGKQGICMMRATASTQVSVDYEDMADALRKFRIANALGPLFAFITDNAPIFEDARIGAFGGTEKCAKSGLPVPYRMARMACWDDTDSARSLIMPGAFDENFDFRDYADFLMEQPAIFLPPQGPESPSEYLGFTPFRELLENEELDEAMILHALSIFFFDARFKSYLELRQADSLPLDYALSFVALVCGIFYNTQALEYYLERFNSLSPDEVAQTKSELRAHGYNAVIYGRKVTEWLDEMICFAEEGLSESDLPYLKPLAELVAKRQTPLEALAS